MPLPYSSLKLRREEWTNFVFQFQMSCFRIQIETCRTRLFLNFFLKPLTVWIGRNGFHTSSLLSQFIRLNSAGWCAKFKIHIVVAGTTSTWPQANHFTHVCVLCFMLQTLLVSSFVITNQSHCCLQQLLVWASCMATLNNQLLFDSQSIVLTSQTMASWHWNTHSSVLQPWFRIFDQWWNCEWSGMLELNGEWSGMLETSGCRAMVGGHISML